MVKIYKSVIAWKIHLSIPFWLVCILFIFASVTYEIIDFWRDVSGFQHTDGFHGNQSHETLLF